VVCALGVASALALAPRTGQANWLADGLARFFPARRAPELPPLPADGDVLAIGEKPDWQQHPDLVVLADLHMGEGQVRGRISDREHFTFDREFADLVQHLVRRQKRAGGRKLQLVLAGDTFDFWFVSRPPSGERWLDKGVRRDYRPTERDAQQKLRRIWQEHLSFFGALRELLAAGHDVVFLAGNHDQEINFPGVRQALQEMLATRGLRGRLRFERWIELEGGALVEHGQRYDPLNSLEYVLAPFRQGRRNLRLRPSAGTFFVTDLLSRRLKGKRPTGEGMGLVWDLAKSMRPHVRSFLAQMLDRAGPLDPEVKKEIAEEHQHRLRRLARELHPTINKTRSRWGKGPLDSDSVLARLSTFDEKQATPILRRSKRTRASRFWRAMALSRPIFSSLVRPPQTVASGQAFALENLADVMVVGHTHNAYHYQVEIDGRTKQLANPGTWAKPESLTYVEVRQTRKRPRVRLKRWDGRRRESLSIAPQKLKKLRNRDVVASWR
jgi:UDP-2,3-diacylglucosamine pyrophosphatase LpxH